MATSLYCAAHPIQPLYLDADDDVRFKPNALVIALIQQHPTPLEDWLTDPTFDLFDKCQLVQLLGFSLARVREMKLDISLPTNFRVRKRTADCLRHPVQPLILDSKSKCAVLRFKKNKLVDRVRQTGPLDLNNLFMLGAHRRDWDQLAQLIGYSHASTPSYLSNRSWKAADREWRQRKAQVKREQRKHWASVTDAALRDTLSSTPVSTRMNLTSDDSVEEKSISAPTAAPWRSNKPRVAMQPTRRHV